MWNKLRWDFSNPGIFIGIRMASPCFCPNLGKMQNSLCWWQGNKTCWNFKTPRKSAFNSVSKNFSRVFLHTGIPTTMEPRVAFPYFCTSFSIVLYQKVELKKMCSPLEHPDQSFRLRFKNSKLPIESTLQPDQRCAVVLWFYTFVNTQIFLQ